MTTTFKTDTPQLSAATIARIRAAAHRYVLAGGSIFPNMHDGDRDEHISNLDAELHRSHSADHFAEVLKAHVKDFTAHETLYTGAWEAIGHRTDAGFLFGAFVGLELAALTFGAAVAGPTAKRGGRR